MAQKARSDASNSPGNLTDLIDPESLETTIEIKVMMAIANHCVTVNDYGLFERLCGSTTDKDAAGRSFIDYVLREEYNHRYSKIMRILVDKAGSVDCMADHPIIRSIRDSPCRYSSNTPNEDLRESSGTDSTLMNTCLKNDYNDVIGLLQAGANPNHVTSGGMTVSICAIARSQKNWDNPDGPDGEAKIRALMILDALKDAGLDPNIRSPDLQNKTALIAAASAASDLVHPSLLAKLLEIGADPNIATTEGSTPLMFAIKGEKTFGIPYVGRICYPECARMLLEAGANPDEENYNGDTPLNLACDGIIHHVQNNEYEDYVQIAKMLLKCGVNIEESLYSESPITTMKKIAEPNEYQTELLALLENRVADNKIDYDARTKAVISSDFDPTLKQAILKVMKHPTKSIGE